MVATVRAQVLLTLFSDWEQFTTFKPDPRHDAEVHALFDQLITWGRALKTVRVVPEVEDGVSAQLGTL
jgi:hypothetical protein